MNRSPIIWAELPDVAISNVYKYLGNRDLLNASRTCWHWRGVVFQRRWVWKWIVWLWFEGKSIIFAHLDIFQCQRQQQPFWVRSLFGSDFCNCFWKQRKMDHLCSQRRYIRSESLLFVTSLSSLTNPLVTLQLDYRLVCSDHITITSFNAFQVHMQRHLLPEDTSLVSTPK